MIQMDHWISDLNFLITSSDLNPLQFQHFYNFLGFFLTHFGRPILDLALLAWSSPYV